MVDNNFDYNTPNYNEEYEEPETWTLISAFDWVLNEVTDSHLSKEFWEKCKNPIDYLTKEQAALFLMKIIGQNQFPHWNQWRHILKTKYSSPWETEILHTLYNQSRVISIR